MRTVAAKGNEDGVQRAGQWPLVRSEQRQWHEPGVGAEKSASVCDVEGEKQCSDGLHWERKQDHSSGSEGC